MTKTMNQAVSMKQILDLVRDDLARVEKTIGLETIGSVGAINTITGANNIINGATNINTANTFLNVNINSKTQHASVIITLLAIFCVCYYYYEYDSCLLYAMHRMTNL